MAGQYGSARANDIVPNGPIVPIPAITLPGTLNLATYATYGSPSVLNCLCSGTWNVSSIGTAIQANGVSHAASAEVYLPVNGQGNLYLNGSGTFTATLYTTRAQE